VPAPHAQGYPAGTGTQVPGRVPTGLHQQGGGHTSRQVRTYVNIIASPDYLFLNI